MNPMSTSTSSQINALAQIEAASALRDWLNRCRKYHKKIPAPNYTFPPIVSWLREQIGRNRKLICGNGDTGFVIGFLLLSHAIAWARGFQDRLIVDATYGRRGPAFSKTRDVVAQVLRKIEYDLQVTISIFDDGAPQRTFHELYCSEPEKTARFLTTITDQWHILPSAVKFGLLGGFDAAANVPGANEKIAAVAVVIGSAVACDSHSRFRIPMRIVPSEITERKIFSAKVRLRSYPRTGMEVFMLRPCLPAMTQGLCRNKSAKGLFKSPGRGRHTPHCATRQDFK